MVAVLINAILNISQLGALEAVLHVACRHDDGEQDDHADEEESSDLHFRAEISGIIRILKEKTNL
jgi:hypothetical protein